MAAVSRLTLIALLSACAPAFAQTEPSSPEAELTEAQAQMEMLQAQMEALRKQIESVKKQIPPVQWRGAPQSSNTDGFSFKPRGTFQYDVYYTRNPGDFRQTAANPFGFQGGFRRALIGADGALPGGFSYSVEFNFTNGSVGYEDVVIRYARQGSPWQFTAGFQKLFSGLDDLTSNRFTTFAERAAFVEAFAYERRLGFATRYRQGNMVLMAGLFNEGIQSARDNNGWALAARAAYNPKIGNTQYHAAVNSQFRKAREGGQAFQVRARPARGTDVRFADTGSIAAKSDWVLGGELALINGPWSLAGEAAYMKLNAVAPADPLIGPDATTGARLAGDPAFMGGYVEATYSFTGETRGYNAGDGRFDRTRVANPLDKGGSGALMGALRVDYLDLSDTVDPVRSAAIGSGGGTSPCVSATASTCFIDGGKQLSFLANLTWNPIDYVMVKLQYGYSRIKDAPANASFNGLGSRISTNPSEAARRLNDYGVHAVTLRTQLDW